MKVAYLTSQYPAPSHTFIRREVEALRKKGVDVHTFSVRRPEADFSSRYPDDQRAYETTDYLLPVGAWRLARVHLTTLLRRPARYLAALLLAVGHRAPGLRAFVWSLFYFGEAVVLAETLRRLKIQHVHSHFANVAGNVGLISSALLSIGWSITLHGDMDFDYPSRLLLAAKARAARFVACVSYFGRAQAMRVIPSKYWHKLVVVRCGVDVSVFGAPGPSQQPRDGQRLRILTVARLSPEKGQIGLIQAFAGLVERGTDAELRIIGEGPMRREIEREIASRGLGDRCVLLGTKTEGEVVAELAQADIVALSSFLEGLPVVLMEALAMERAVVAPCVAGVPELVIHERTGLLFAPSHWDDLEAQLARLAADPKLRAELGREGHRVVMREFDASCAVEPLAVRFTSRAV